MIFIFILCLLLAVVGLFVATTVPYAAILSVWQSGGTAEGIVQPFLKMVVYESADGTIPTNLQEHEREHLRQIEHYGRFKFVVLYLYYNIKYGYYNNPLEIAAREAENGNAS